MSFVTEPDHSPYVPLEQEARNEVPYLESELLTATPAPVWPRSASFTLTTIVIVLVAILVVLGFGELRELNAEREEKARVEFCEDWAQTDFPTPDSCQ